MLDIAVTFLADELNSYLRQHGMLTQQDDLVMPSLLADDTGKWQIDPGKIGLSLINIEEERILREQTPDRIYQNGNHVVIQPALKLNLTLLFATRANTSGTASSNYLDALDRLSHVMTFFQARPSFSSDNCPGLDPRIAKLNVELLSLTPEQLNQTWAYLGSKYLPSAIYRVRMLMLQDAQPSSVDKPILAIATEVVIR